MAIIGTFKRAPDSTYTGEIDTLTLYRKARLVPTESTTQGAPALRIFSGQSEIGAAWQKTSRGGDAYYSVKLDDPALPAPVWANLVASTKEIGVYHLLWERQRPQAA